MHLLSDGLKSSICSLLCRISDVWKQLNGEGASSSVGSVSKCVYMSGVVNFVAVYISLSFNLINKF